MTWSGRDTKRERERRKADSKRMLRKKAALGERFYSDPSLGGGGPSEFMKLCQGDVLEWMQREALRVEPEDDGVGVLEKQRPKLRRDKDGDFI